jgi:hypothetical protein
MDTSNITGRGLDNRIKSRLNQEKVLKALHRFGWLPVRQVHQACWPTEATPRNAQRYLAQLLELKQITFKDGPDGSRVFALTSLGAKRLRTELGIEASHDVDFARRGMPSYYHRCLANDVGLWWSRLHGESAGYYTEHEIVTGRAPVSSAPKYMSDPLGKVPDALLTLKRPVTPENPYTQWLAWVEVEFSDKPRAEHAHMVQALCDVLAFGKQRWEISNDSVLRHAVVVCPRTSHEYQLVEGVLQFLGANSSNYDVKYIVNHVVIWRPGAEEGVSLVEWIEGQPAFLALRDKLKLWWPALPKI